MNDACVGLLLQVGVQVSDASPMSTSYAPPLVEAVTPHDITTDGGTVVSIQGRYFGALASAVEILVGGEAVVVSATLWPSRVQLACPP